MDAVTFDTLAEASLAAFAADGPLASADPAYQPRDVQMRMTEAVAAAVSDGTALVAEAGTGVGKTYAYLVPVLLSGRRALLSTATKNLQDQLYFRDLPRLCKALNIPASTALLKGRGSYLCLHRLQQARNDAQLPDLRAVRTLARIETWALSTNTGDLGELEGLDERSDVIPLVTSTRDNCLGSECPSYDSCHVMRARREAMAADLVVINHHLFFADLALRDSGVAELLPTVDAVVFDEAHQMVEAGVQFLGAQLGSGQLLDYARDLLAAGLQHARGLAPWDELTKRAEQAARALRLAVDVEVSGQAIVKLRWDAAAALPAFAEALAEAAEACTGIAAALEPLADTAPDLARMQQRSNELTSLAARFAQPAAADRVRWIDVSAHQLRLIESPLDIRELMNQQRDQGRKAWIYTSATLGDDEALSWFSDAAGLADARKLRLGSPFDYPNRARLYVPQRFPEPRDADHPRRVGRAAAHCAAALQGRTFVLTTTLRVLHIIADALSAELAKLGRPLELLVQGSAAKRELIARFQQGGSVLIGSQSFWEGIDVPGDALQCVVIDKLPFAPPNDPLVEARVRQLKAAGRNAFNDYFVADAAVSLKQGAGRLIRTETDRGLLVICDTRLHGTRYGARLIDALPPMTALGSSEEALTWLREIAGQGA